MASQQMPRLNGKNMYSRLEKIKGCFDKINPYTKIQLVQLHTYRAIMYTDM